MAYVLTVARDQGLGNGLRESVGEILTGSTLFALATVGSDGGPHANTAFFAHDCLLLVYFVSERSTRHSLNLRDDPRAMASVFLDPPVYGEQLRGVQMKGVAAEVPTDETASALATYRRKFPTFADDPQVRERFHQAEGPSVIYRFTVNAVTVIDEPRFGRRNYIEATVSR
jgi:uncharacterized protein YhbP (UPF0306 family)